MKIGLLLKMIQIVILGHLGGEIMITAKDFGLSEQEYYAFDDLNGNEGCCLVWDESIMDWVLCKDNVIQLNADGSPRTLRAEQFKIVTEMGKI